MSWKASLVENFKRGPETWFAQFALGVVVTPRTICVPPRRAATRKIQGQAQAHPLPSALGSLRRAMLGSNPGLVWLYIFEYLMVVYFADKGMHGGAECETTGAEMPQAACVESFVY